MSDHPISVPLVDNVRAKRQRKSSNKAASGINHIQYTHSCQSHHSKGFSKDGSLKQVGDLTWCHKSVNSHVLINLYLPNVVQMIPDLLLKFPACIIEVLGLLSVHRAK